MEGTASSDSQKNNFACEEEEEEEEEVKWFCKKLNRNIMENRKIPESVVPTEKLPHPDAKFRGKSGETELKLQEAIIKIRIDVDERDPKTWGNCSIFLFVPGLIVRTGFKNLKDLESFGRSFSGSLAEKIQEALRQIDPDIY